jgi:hypothetical protein
VIAHFGIAASLLILARYDLTRERVEALRAILDARTPPRP